MFQMLGRPFGGTRSISGALVVTAGFLRAELGPDLLREVRGSSGILNLKFLLREQT